MSQLLVVCSDLIFTTKITGTAHALGLKTKVLPTGSSMEGNADISKVVVDLNTIGTTREELARVREVFPLPTTLIAFGSHVEAERLREARQAGFDRVLPRSEFSARLVDLLSP